MVDLEVRVRKLASAARSCDPLVSGNAVSELLLLLRSTDKVAGRTSLLILGEHKDLFTMTAPDPKWDGEELTSIVHCMAEEPMCNDHNDRDGVAYNIFRNHAEMLPFNIGGAEVSVLVCVSESSERVAMEVAKHPKLLDVDNGYVATVIIENWLVPTVEIFKRYPGYMEGASPGTSTGYGIPSVLVDKEGMKSKVEELKEIWAAHKLPSRDLWLP